MGNERERDRLPYLRRDAQPTLYGALRRKPADNPVRPLEKRLSDFGRRFRVLCDLLDRAGTAKGPFASKQGTCV